MVFLFILVSIILILIFSKIKIEIKNLKISSNIQKHLATDYIIEFKLYILKKIPIIKFTITDEKIRKLKIKQKLEKVDIKKIEKDLSINKIKEIIKKSKFIIKKFKLKAEIGTENASFTAIVIPIVSTIISFILKNKIKNYNYKNQKFIIKPIFLNKNIINIDFSGIFEVKMIHIINIMYIINKKEGVKKYERTSNRRSYAYSYE